MQNDANSNLLGPIAFDLCGPRGAGQAIGAFFLNDFAIFNLHLPRVSSCALLSPDDSGTTHCRAYL